MAKHTHAPVCFCACRFNCWYWMRLWCDCLIKFNKNQANATEMRGKGENYWQLA